MKQGAEERQVAIQRLGQALEWRYPLRWASAETSRGDFDGRDRTVEVFNIEPSERLSFLRAIRDARAHAEKELGAPLVFVFHTPDATRRHYAALFPVIRRVRFSGGQHRLRLPLTARSGPGGAPEHQAGVLMRVG